MYDRVNHTFRIPSQYLPSIQYNCLAIGKDRSTGRPAEHAQNSPLFNAVIFCIAVTFDWHRGEAATAEGPLCTDAEATLYDNLSGAGVLNH